MASLLKAKAMLYNNGLFQALVPYREILTRAKNIDFWHDPKNKSFVDLIDNNIKEQEKKYKKQITRKEVLKRNLLSLYLLQGNIENISKHLKEVELNFIKPFEYLLSNM